MSLSKIEICKLEELYSSKIQQISESFDKNQKRFRTEIKFYNNFKSVSRLTSSWRLETIIGRKLNTIRLGGDETCDHIDGNPMNDDPNNLQLMSHADNNRKSIIQNNLIGENSPRSKLSTIDVNNIRKLYFNDGVPLITIWKLYKVNKATIQDILRFKNWKSVNFDIPENSQINNARCKLTKDDVFKLINMKTFEGYSIKDLSLIFKINDRTVADILRGDYWKQVPRCYYINLLGKTMFIKQGSMININNVEYIFIGKCLDFPNTNCIYIDDIGNVVKRSFG